MSTTNKHNIEVLCHRYQAIILEYSTHRLRVAVSEPPTSQMIEALRFASQHHVEIECWPHARIEQYSQHKPTTMMARESSPEERQSASAVELVDKALHVAIQRRASDIHFEPQANGLRIRLRIDGVLHPLTGCYDNIKSSILSRLKILGNLDIAKKRIPQDGQFSLEINRKMESFRLSTLPTCYGEKAVIRLLHNNSQTIALDKLGMSPNTLACYRTALARPQGLILATGPTGSGKTFTLYSGLSALNHPSKNLCSVEDPIEIPLLGVNQIQINNKSGLTFHCVLRSLLRQDPDVIMLGEIRDNESAEIAIKAAQTGHLVLSTLHTNSTSETLIRLHQMGIPCYMVASALKLIITQRLVRRLCPHCRQPTTDFTHLPAALWQGTLKRWSATGCDHCFSGYYGRLALFEMLPINNHFQQAIASDATPDELTKWAQQQGISSLYSEGLHAVNRGDTSFEEINRIIGTYDG